jgi:hypothetical protein
MADTDLVLRFEIVPGRNPEADSIADAISAFVETLKAAADVVEPGSDLSVELVSVEPGSQRFLLALRKGHDVLERIDKGGDKFPLYKKALISLGSLIGSTVVIVGVTTALTPDPRIPDDQMKTFEEMNRNMAESLELQRKAAKFWGITQDEPAIDGVEVLRDDRTQLFKVPRSEFADRSGMWSQDDDAAPTPTVEPRTATWDVILVKPVLVPEKRRWTFARDGLEFSALMTDKAVLQAIHDKTLPLQLAEGVSMKIEVQYRERFDGKVWLPVPGSHRVKRVISPRPNGPPLPLFLPADAP